VQDGITGRVVDGLDVNEIADATSEILAAPDRGAAMGAAGRSWIVDSWQWRSQAARLEGLLSTP
jgi:phosphatidylinositol alpha-1,6-mannosyltransferase